MTLGLATNAIVGVPGPAGPLLGPVAHYMTTQNRERLGPSFICQPSPSLSLTPLIKAAVWSILSWASSAVVR
jgi:hypothetical protein|eukprot:COSAG06_NODE_767_length_12466_cov_6.536508_4_plen_72_part_00